MKTCPECKSEVDEDFAVCWNCQFVFDENYKEVNNMVYCNYCSTYNEIENVYCKKCQCKLPKDPDAPVVENPGEKKLDCLRCKVPMTYKGKRKFHEGGVMADLMGAPFVNKEELDLYYCPKCGKVEFFLL